MPFSPFSGIPPPLLKLLAPPSSADQAAKPLHHRRRGTLRIAHRRLETIQERPLQVRGQALQQHLHLVSKIRVALQGRPYRIAVGGA